MTNVKKYNGSVFHVDLLGFSALTNGGMSDKLQDEDYQAWGLNSMIDADIHSGDILIYINEI